MKTTRYAVCLIACGSGVARSATSGTRGVLTYLGNIFVRVSTLPSRDGHQFCAAVVDSSQNEGLPKAVDAIHDGSRVFPVTETNIIASNSTCVAQNGEEKPD